MRCCSLHVTLPHSYCATPLWLLAGNICRGGEHLHALHPALPAVLASLAAHGGEEDVVKNALYCLAHLADHPQVHADVEQCIVLALASLTAHVCEPVAIPGVAFLAALGRREDRVRALRQCGALAVVQRVVDAGHPSKALAADTAFLLERLQHRGP